MAAFITAEIVTVKGDNLTVDTIVARRFRAYLPGYVERVLDLNPGLAACGPILPLGRKIALPAPLRREQVTEIEVVKLWE